MHDLLTFAIWFKMSTKLLCVPLLHGLIREKIVLNDQKSTFSLLNSLSYEVNWPLLHLYQFFAKVVEFGNFSKESAPKYEFSNPLCSGRARQ